MAFAKVFGAQVTGLRGNIVRVEVDRTRGLHAFSIVGLAGKAVEESRERVSAALKNSGFDNIKSQNQKIILSLSHNKFTSATRPKDSDEISINKALILTTIASLSPSRNNAITINCKCPCAVILTSNTS